MFYYNNQENFFYFVTHRNGSTIIQEISGVYPSVITPMTMTECFTFLKQNPNTPIIIPFREPETRFKSGLMINFNRDVSDDHSIEELLKLNYGETYKSKIQYMDVMYHNTFLSGVARGYRRRPYHLLDIHLDHSLWMPLFLIAYGFNVKLIALSDFSIHLKPLYPLAISFIKARERSNSSTTNRPLALKLWEIYKSVYLNPTLPIYFKDSEERYSMRTLSWKKWMQPEKEIYKIFHVYKNSENLQTFSVKLLNKLIEDKVYFTDVFSIAMRNQMHFLQNLHLHIEPIKEFKYMVETHETLLSSFSRLSLREYLPPPPRKRVL